MAHKYNLNLIKSRRSYSIKDMALLFGKNGKTFSRWIKDGDLKVIETGVSPLLVMGEELERCIRDKRSSKKVPLQKDEFFCRKCHKAVRAKAGSKVISGTGKTIGKDRLEQMVASGLCEACGTKVMKFLRVCQKD